MLDDTDCEACEGIFGDLGREACKRIVLVGSGCEGCRAQPRTVGPMDSQFVCRRLMLEEGNRGWLIIYLVALGVNQC